MRAKRNCWHRPGFRAKKGNDKIGGKNGVAGAYTLGGTSLAATMMLAFA